MVRHAKRIASVNQKGGVGKTTSAVNLSYGLVQEKKSVLLIDLDPQGNASQNLGIRDESSGHDLLEAIKMPISKNLAPIVWETEYGIDVIANSHAFAVADKYMLEEHEPTKLLSVMLDALEREHDYAWDYIVMDCPRALSIVSLNALACADLALIPCELGSFSLSGLEDVVKTINRIKRSVNPPLQYRILPVRFDSKDAFSKEILAEIKKEHGKNLVGVAISESKDVKQAPYYEEPVGAFSARSRGAKDYQKLSREIGEMF